jgi:hypothetical protein
MLPSNILRFSSQESLEGNRILFTCCRRCKDPYYKSLGELRTSCENINKNAAREHLLVTVYRGLRDNYFVSLQSIENQ